MPACATSDNHSDWGFYCFRQRGLHVPGQSWMHQNGPNTRAGFHRWRLQRGWWTRRTCSTLNASFITGEYHIGLDIDVCESEHTRLLSNVWNEARHGKLYEEVGSETRDISWVLPAQRENVAGYNKGNKMRYICLMLSCNLRSFTSVFAV